MAILVEKTEIFQVKYGFWEKYAFLLKNQFLMQTVRFFRKIERFFRSKRRFLAEKPDFVFKNPDFNHFSPIFPPNIHLVTGIILRVAVVTGVLEMFVYSGKS